MYLFLKPNNINEAIDLMSEINGIYQHNFYENPSPINHECFICKSDKQFIETKLKMKRINDRYVFQ